MAWAASLYVVIVRKIRIALNSKAVLPETNPFFHLDYVHQWFLKVPYLHYGTCRDNKLTVQNYLT